MRPIGSRALRAAILALLIGPAGGRAQEYTAIVNAEVVPMTADTVLHDHAVLVRGAFIEAVSPTDSLRVPRGARVIDARGGWLLPGLADLHVHLSTYDPDPGHLVLYLARGVTSVRCMEGTRVELAWRESVRRGELVGPSIMTSGRVISGIPPAPAGIHSLYAKFRIAVILLPLAVAWLALLAARFVFRLAVGRTALAVSLVALMAGLAIARLQLVPFMATERFWKNHDTFFAENPRQAMGEVRAQAKAGFDLVKVYDYLSEDAYLAAVREAKRLGIYVTGHLPDAIPLDTIARSGQDEIAHTEELVSYAWKGYDPSRGYGAAVNARLEIDRSRLPGFAALLARHRMAAVSTGAEEEMRVRLIEDTPGVLAGPEYGLVRPRIREFIASSGRNVTSWRGQGPYRRDVLLPFVLEIDSALARGGVVLAIGTDVIDEGMIPGYHLARGVELLVEAGLSPFEALRSATASAGEVGRRMGASERFGAIAPGARADIVLLGGNPLLDVGALRENAGVMARGRWYPREELDTLVARFTRTY